MQSCGFRNRNKPFLTCHRTFDTQGHAAEESKLSCTSAHSPLDAVEVLEREHERVRAFAAVSLRLHRQVELIRHRQSRERNLHEQKKSAGKQDQT